MVGSGGDGLLMANIRICCPIEMEPKTLSEGQLNLAREVAADVAQKMEPKEASIIFIKGVEPVGVEEKEPMQQQKPQQVSNTELEFNNVAANNDQKISQVIEKPCQCSVMDVNADSPDQSKIKEPATAPF